MGCSYCQDGKCVSLCKGGGKADDKKEEGKKDKKKGKKKDKKGKKKGKKDKKKGK